MQPHIESGRRATFNYHGKKAEGYILAAGPTRVHIQSGNRGVYVSPDDVLSTRPVPEDEIPMLGERLRLFGGVDQ